MTKQETALVEREPTPDAQLPEAVASPIVQIIERAVQSETVDVEALKQLLAMQERIMDREAAMAFSVAMKGAQGEMPAIVKEGYNKTTKSRFAKLEAICEAIQPVIDKYGFSLSFGTDDCPLENHYRVTCLVDHVAGHTRDYHADIPADIKGMKGSLNKSPTHGFGSTMSYGRRYLTVLIFNLRLINEDDDGNAASEDDDLISAKQLVTLEKLLEDLQATDRDIETLCEWLKVDALQDLPAKQFEDAKQVLEQKLKG